MHLVRDFHTNNHMYVEITMLPGMKFCVKLAGKVTQLKRRIQIGPGSPGSIKLQEGERGERIIMFLRSSSPGQEITEANPDTKEMQKLLDRHSLSYLQLGRISKCQVAPFESVLECFQ